MISVDEALARILAAVPAPKPETVPLGAAHRRTLLAPLIARHHQPPFDASAMDGYAVRVADILPGAPLFLAGTAQAGQRFTGMMQRGECVRIFTGAPLPVGADAVIMQEDSEAHGNQVRFSSVPRHGQSIRKKGGDFVSGVELLPTGTPLTPAMLGLAASANFSELSVARRPKLALVATGDELVPPGRPFTPDQIVASNSVMLAALFASAQILDLGIVADDRRALERAFLAAFDDEVDIVVTTGGASVGERDYVKTVLADLGVTLDFWQVAMRPGKPVIFGTRGKTLVFGLPGNPVSAFVTALVLVLPALRALGGHSEPSTPVLHLPLAADLPANGARRHYRRAIFAHGGDASRILPINETDSAHMSSLARCDALIIQPEHHPGAGIGDIIALVPLNFLG